MIILDIISKKNKQIKEFEKKSMMTYELIVFKKFCKSFMIGNFISYGKFFNQSKI